MWTGAGTNRWSRDDGEGYLLADGDTMLELHRDTLHVYRLNPKADKTLFVGSPLDGYVWQSTEPAREVPAPPAAVCDAPTAWRLLGDRAATVDATRTSAASPTMRTV